MTAGRRILLVTGCPRSGTTALVRLLNTHPQVAIGVERFTRRLLDTGRLERELFDPERFERFQKGDGNRVSFDSAATKTAVAKASHAEVIGDKSPNPAEVFKAAKAIGDVSLVVVLREPQAVARSFQVRADRARQSNEAAQYWPATRDFRQGIREFNGAIAATLSFVTEIEADSELKKRIRLKIVEYESMFRDRAKALDLFAFLGVDGHDAERLDALYTEAENLTSRTKKTPLIDTIVALKAKHRDYARALELVQRPGRRSSL